MNDPIFILGITKRSGTNYLRDLLCLHPDCWHGGPIWENYLLDHAEMLEWYAKFTYHHWNPDWQVSHYLGQTDALCAAMGQGLISFLNQQRVPHKLRAIYDPDHVPIRESLRLVTKSPGVDNLKYFFKLFPRARLLIIIRDGRAVTESTVKTFGRTYETAMREWYDGAQTILQFLQDTNANDHKYLIVKYEDLYHNTDQELTKIFQFLDLEVSRYDFAAVPKMPVRGSSEVTKTGHIHWKAIQKSQDFDPTKRYSHWGAALHARFNWVNGEVSARLGYPCETDSNHQPKWLVRNLLLDLFWKPIWPLRQMVRKLKYMVGK